MITLGVVLTVASVLYAFTLSLKSMTSVDANQITISTVTEGDFEDVVLLDASVEPLTSVIVSSSEGGVVEQMYVENGAKVHAGQPILKISNPNALLSYTGNQTAITEQVNQLRKVKLDLEQNQRNLQEDMIELEYNLDQARRQYRIDTNLFAKGVIPTNDFRKTSREYNYYLSKQQVLRQAVKQENESRNLQLRQIEQSMDQMNESLNIIRQNIENMTIKAPASGSLSSFNPVLGKFYQANEMLGKIDVMQGYKLQAGVDEYYVNRIRENQTGTCEYNGKTYDLIVRKVVPEVANGLFQVELTFAGRQPEELRRGLSLPAKITLSDSHRALLLNQGQFYQGTGGNWVFVVDDSGKAVKRNIRLGRKNNRYYEVQEGLKAGDRVITSSYATFQQYSEIQIDQH